jgi:hypothetical protein
MDEALIQSLRIHSLESAQIHQVLRLRLNLQRILSVIREVNSGVKCLFEEPRVYKGLKDWDQKDTKSYMKYDQWKTLSLETFYMLLPPDFLVFPSWLDKTPLVNLHELFGNLAPFTAMSLYEYTKNDENTAKIEASLVNAIKSIDDLFLSTRAKQD